RGRRGGVHRELSNRLAPFREGEPPCEPAGQGARTEPRPPRITNGDFAVPDQMDRLRLDELFLTAFGRPPSDHEARRCLDFLAKDSSSADCRLAWADLCHVLINTKEFLFIDLVTVRR